MKGRVYKQGNVWYYRFDIAPDPLTGKRRQVSGSGYATERQAWKECRAAMTDQEKGRVLKTTKRKVASALDEWLTNPHRALDQAIDGTELAQLGQLLRHPLHR